MPSSKLGYFNSKLMLTRTLPGLWIFHRLLGGGGGGGVWTPPWSRLLVAVEKNERQRSKAGEKSFRNHFEIISVIFVLGQNWGLQGSKLKNFPKRFFDDKIFTFNGRATCLVEARRTIYKMVLQGQGQSLTSCQVRPRSRDDRNGSYCISVDSPGQDERTDTNPTSLSLFDQVIGKWRLVTSGDLKWPFEG